MTPSQIHNRDAAEIVKTIILPTMLEAGGDFTDVLVLLESVMTGVVLFGVRAGGDDRVIETLCDHVKKRVAEHRLAAMHPEGNG
ncbi:MAG TPA: hypothetical protein VM867_08295 [Xanthobacteraceae bacterium]|nr:hypothetical protein [Xanthobacteraceae bacterium]